MWQPQEDDHEVSWDTHNRSVSKSDWAEKGPHKDYSWNLEVAQNFINKTKDSLRPGMKVAIVSSQWIEKALLMISWMPPRTAKLGNWANPINLHQCRFAFGKELEGVFNDYVRNVTDFERNSKERMLPEYNPLS